MKQFNRLLAGLFFTWLLLSGLTAYLIHHENSETGVKRHLVEINRMEDELMKEKAPFPVDLSNYHLIKQVDYFPADYERGIFEFLEENQEVENASVTIPAQDRPRFMKAFFSGGGIDYIGISSIPDGCSYLIKPLYIDFALQGYVRYAFSDTNKNGTFLLIIMVETILAAAFLFLFVLLFYIRRNILKPFNEISELPYELSKGHLAKEMKETKNRYYGKFIWGLNLLRQSLEQHKEKQLELEKDKKLMVLSISHDIKTPLSTIKLYSKALYEGLYSSEEKKLGTAKLIEEKADQIEKYIADIIKTSSTELFDFQTVTEDFYLSSLITTIRRTYEEKLELLKIDFTIHPYLDKMLSGDFDKLIDVFDNLIQNAIKYGDGSRITLSFEQEDNYQLILVTNTGSPLPANDMVHMFESFWRGSNASGKQGNGLGLYICKQLLLKMGGDIYAQAQEDGMSLVVVIKKS